MASRAFSSSWRISGKTQASSRKESTRWAPWPGNSKAKRVRLGPDEARTPAEAYQLVPLLKAVMAPCRIFWKSSSVWLLSSSRTATRRNLADGWKVRRLSRANHAKPVSAAEGTTETAAARSSWLSAERAIIWMEPSHAGVWQGVADSSRMAWKLDPPKPKALTPARRGWPFIGLSQGLALEGRWNGQPGSSSAGSGVPTLRVGGCTPWRRAKVAFKRPAVPAAPLA